MKEKIRMLKINVDSCNARQAMKRSVRFLESEPINLIQLLSIDLLLYAKDREEFCGRLDEMDLMIPGQRGILEAAGIEDAKREQEIEGLLYMKLMLRFFHKKHSRICLVAESEERLEELSEYMRAHAGGCQIVGTVATDGAVSKDDMAANEINGCEPDCVIAALPAPDEQEFVFRNRARINARMWIGTGGLLDAGEEARKGRNKLSACLKRIFLKREMKKSERQN